jgi:hypothetical protein
MKDEIGIVGAGFMLGSMGFFNVMADESAALAPAPTPGLANEEVRLWYNAQLKTIDTSGPLTEVTAARVNAARNAIKQQARDMMADRAAAEQLAKDRPLEPLQYYIDKYSKQGYQGEALWKKIIESATRPNAAVNKRFGIQ